MHSSNHITKFADDTTVVGLISKNNESAYREEVQRLTAWCKDNNLSLNVNKTKEMVVDFRRAQSDHSPLNIDGSNIEIIKSTKFLGVHLAEDLTWSLNTSSITKKAQQRLYFLRSLRKAHLPPPILTTFYRGTIESILSSCITAWFGNCTISDRKTLQRIVRTAEKIIGVSLPSITYMYTTHCIRKARSIVDDPTHTPHTHSSPSCRLERRTEAFGPSQPDCVTASFHRQSVPNFIPDRSRPGLTTAAIGAVDLQGAGGNWATVGGRSRGGRRVRRQREKRKGKSVGLRIGTLNVGTMTGKGRELADMMERRKVDILCVQETRWKGSKARSIGAGFKLFYYGVDSKRNGVGVVLKEEFVRNVLEVKSVSDRVMSLKLEIEGVMLNVVSGYAPQVGCELEEKERFWSELDEVMESIPTGERVVIGADFNGHVGEGNTGDEEVMGKFGVKERNLEGQMVVDFAKRMDMGVVNTYFQKREEHRVTYKSGGRRTQVDYILCRRGNLKEISDCKVVVGESVARQHRMVVCRMTLMVCKKKRSKIEIEKKTKWWKLKKEECCEEFRQKLRQALGGQVVLPDDWETTAEVIRETGRKVLGVSSGRRKEDKETWWWNEEVQDSIQRKRLAKKKWDMDRTEENRQEYKELQRRVKREVSKAKQKAYDELYTRLDTREGEKDLYRLARQRDRDGKDVQQVRVIKDRDGRVLTSEESVQRRWKEYFEELMNEENEREKRVEGVNSVEQKVDKIRKDEVRKALKRMKSGKAVGPDDIPVEVWKCLGEAAVEFLASLFNRVLESERMPEEWRSVLVRIKGKVYRTVVRAAMLYGLETVSLRKRQESELEVAELKMLRFSLGVTRLDRIRNEYIRGTAHVGRLGDKVREARLRWFGHVQRRESEYIGRRMLDMELPGRRQRGRPKRRMKRKLQS
ncbi:hypothetical protein QTP86_007948 [Hemibagrus guttatus]|nr:hypothetical protein QTP86_007948 [Hemibagrus guttatus]